MILLHVKYQSDQPLNANRCADIQADSPGFSENLPSPIWSKNWRNSKALS